MFVVLCRCSFTGPYIAAIRRQIPPPIRIKEIENLQDIYMDASPGEFGILFGETNTEANHEVMFKAFHEKNGPFSISLSELRLFFEDLIKPRSPSLEQIVSSELEDLE